MTRIPGLMRGLFIAGTCTILSILLGGDAATSFTSTPTSVNATLGSTATFNCSATTGIVDWMVNRSLLTELDSQDLTTTSFGTIFSLHVPATEKYNMTSVTCKLVIRDSPFVETSDPAVLRVQGLPDGVSNLASEWKNESLSQVIRLTWDAPFSLDITGVDPDIWYRVDVTVDNNYFSTYDDINVTQFNFTMADYNNTSTRVIYEFRVTPINSAGDGITSDPVTGYFIGSPRSITEDVVETRGSATPLNVNFTITCGNIPPGELPDRLQVHAETVDAENKLRYCSDDIPVTPDSDGRVLIQLNASTPTCTPDILKPHRRYKVILTAKNHVGETNSTGNILFSTHEAQTCAVNNCSQPGTVNISCTFTENSKARGYLSIISSKTNPLQERFVVASRNNMSSLGLNVSVAGLPRDNYAVVVYDLGGNGLPVLSDVTSPYVLAADEETVNVMTDPEDKGANQLISVNGTFVKVKSTEIQVCVSFDCITSNKRMVVLAHHVDDDDQEELSAYTSNCFTAPAAGNYMVGVFTQNGDNSLEAPGTFPTISNQFSAPPTPAFCTPASSVTRHTPSLWITVGLALLVTAYVVLSEKDLKRLHRIPRGTHLLVVSGLILLNQVTTTQADFVSTPTSVNATLGSIATFNCSTNASGVTFDWLVNGSVLTDLNGGITARQDGKAYFLCIPAREKYNNTSVVCELTIRDSVRSFVLSDPAVLKVQGLLAAVENLTVHSHRSFVLLTWVRPFSLDITGVDSDLWYCVFVYNISRGKTPRTTNSATCAVIGALAIFVMCWRKHHAYKSHLAIDVPDAINVPDVPDAPETPQTTESQVSFWNGGLSMEERYTKPESLRPVTDGAAESPQAPDLPPPTYDSVARREAQHSVPSAHGTADEIEQSQGTSQQPGLHYAAVKTVPDHMKVKPPSQDDDRVLYSDILPPKTLPEEATSLGAETPLPLPNQKENENNGCASCDCDVEDATEEEGDKSEPPVSDEAVSRKLSPHRPQPSSGLSKPQESQLLSVGPSPRMFGGKPILSIWIQEITELDL